MQSQYGCDLSYTEYLMASSCKRVQRQELLYIHGAPSVLARIAVSRSARTELSSLRARKTPASMAISILSELMSKLQATTSRRYETIAPSPKVGKLLCCCAAAAKLTNAALASLYVR